jgi:hypothetical protein
MCELSVLEKRRRFKIILGIYCEVVVWNDVRYLFVVMIIITSNVYHTVSRENISLSAPMTLTVVVDVKMKIFKELRKFFSLLQKF